MMMMMVMFNDILLSLSFLLLMFSFFIINKCLFRVQDWLSIAYTYFGLEPIFWCASRWKNSFLVLEHFLMFLFDTIFYLPSSFHSNSLIQTTSRSFLSLHLSKDFRIIWCNHYSISILLAKNKKLN